MLNGPKNRKFKKDRKGRCGKIANRATRGCTLDKGMYGLVSLSPGRVSGAQLESIRKVIVRHIKKLGGQLFFRIFPDKPITKKAAEVRMGQGKGSVEYYVSLVEPGRIIFEIDGVEEVVARAACLEASDKLGVKTKFVIRETLEITVTNLDKNINLSGVK